MDDYNKRFWEEIHEAFADEQPAVALNALDQLLATGSVTKRDLLTKKICQQCGASWMKKEALVKRSGFPVRLRVRSIGNSRSEGRLRRRIAKHGLPNVCRLVRKINELYKRKSAVKITFKCQKCGLYRVLKRQKGRRRSVNRNTTMLPKLGQLHNKRETCANQSLNRSNPPSRNSSFNATLNLSCAAPGSSGKKKRRSLVQELTRQDKQDAAVRSRPLSLADFLTSLN